MPNQDVSMYGLPTHLNQHVGYFGVALCDLMFHVHNIYVYIWWLTALNFIFGGTYRSFIDNDNNDDNNDNDNDIDNNDNNMIIMITIMIIMIMMIIMII